MSEMMNNKISEEQLNKVAGGNDGMGEGTFSAYDISPRWVRVQLPSSTADIGPTARSPRPMREATDLKSTESQPTASGTGFGSTIPRAASATATFTKTIQSWINTLKTYIIDVS